VRDTPALDVARQLHQRGAEVMAYDPTANGTAATVVPGLTYQRSVEAACRDADLTIVLTEWREFVDLDPREVASWARSPRVIDARNCLPAEAWRDAGWDYMGLGRHHPDRELAASPRAS
jgi:UDPglucose 6-dehydrogenase